MSTKIHAAGDALGNPVRLIATPGQRNDITCAHDLIDGFKACATIADKGFDANHLIDKITANGSEVVIPPKRNRKDPREFDTDLYKERNIIERFFSNSNSSDASQPDTTSSSSTSWASSNSPLSQYGSNS